MDLKSKYKIDDVLTPMPIVKDDEGKIIPQVDKRPIVTAETYAICDMMQEIINKLEQLRVSR